MLDEFRNRSRIEIVTSGNSAWPTCRQEAGKKPRKQKKQGVLVRTRNNLIERPRARSV